MKPGSRKKKTNLHSGPGCNIEQENTKWSRGEPLSAVSSNDEKSIKLVSLLISDAVAQCSWVACYQQMVWWLPCHDLRLCRLWSLQYCPCGYPLCGSPSDSNVSLWSEFSSMTMSRLLLCIYVSENKDEGVLHFMLDCPSLSLSCPPEEPGGSSWATMSASCRTFSEF